MEIVKNKDHVLFKNKLGEYHLSYEKFNKLGKDEASKYAKKEIKKKFRSGNYTQKTIDFNRTEALGFCEYGIEDFCEKLGLDIEEEYEIEFLKNRITENVLEEYPDECLKIFSKSVLDKWGGPKGFLEKVGNIDFVLRGEFIPDRELHLLACDFAESVLPVFEKEFPQDDRPRKAIEIKRLWVDGKVTDDGLKTACYAARAAANAACYAARGVASGGARGVAEKDNQIEMVIKVLEKIEREG